MVMNLDRDPLVETKLAQAPRLARAKGFPVDFGNVRRLAQGQFIETHQAIRCSSPVSAIDYQ